MITDTSCVFRKNDQIVYREIEGASTLIDPYRRVMIELNPVAVEIWRLIDGKRSVAEIVTTLEEIFDIDGNTLKKDVVYFFEDCFKREMIEECSAL